MIEAQIQNPHGTLRWNVEETANGIRICRGFHDKALGCDWEYFVRRPSLVVVADIIRDVAELPDRTSPADWPDAMLVTADELRDIILSHLNP